MTDQDKPRIGWFFAHDWDHEALHRLADGGLARFDTAGFDLFRFPSNAALAWLDLDRFADRQARRGRRAGWRGVLSHQEQFGALAAALTAERLGLPAPSPRAIVAAQHKLHAREVLAQVAPEATVPARVLAARYGEPVPDGLDYPCYVKPVKAAFSVLAREVPDAAALTRHTRFEPAERWIIRHLVEPFDRVRRRLLPEAETAHRLMIETPVPGGTPQYNLDGWVRHGEVHALGVVDAVVHPGTQAFIRWETPSRLPPAVQERALSVARRFLHAIGFDHGCFNMEFFHDPRDDRLTVIEFNPRLASQFGDLYRRVDGRDPHAIAVALALGADPLALPRERPRGAVAASLVYRSFVGQTPPPPPSPRQREALLHEFPDAGLWVHPRHGRALARDLKWTGSHRYGLVHLHGRNHADLHDRAVRASALLGWPAPYADASSAATRSASRASAERQVAANLGGSARPSAG